MKDKINDFAAKQFDRMVRYRRHLHMNPSVSFHEEETVEYIKKQLDEIGISYRTAGKHGIVAKITSDKPGQCIAFRADMDALRLQEKKSHEYASKVPGVMHACGHDGHVATLLGLAHHFNENPHQLKGNVVFIFQYAEELLPGGAAPMIEDGCLDGVDRIYGYHVSDELPAGTVGVRAGNYMAATDNFSVEFTGKGGHGSRPSDTVDTITAMATAVVNINSIISRFVSPLKSAVISICNIHGGHSYNVIPGKVVMEGTSRSYEMEVSELLERKIELAVKSSCEMYGVQYTYRYTRGYPVLTNHERETSLVASTAKKIGYEVTEIEKTPVSEDFGYYLQHIPGTFFRVGIYNPDKDCIYPLHSNKFDLDEDQLVTALGCFIGVYLAETEQL